MGYYSKTKTFFTKTNIIGTSSRNEHNYKKIEAAHDLDKYLQGECFPPSEDTLIKPIKQNHFTTWSGLTEKLIHKHLQPSN